MRGDGPGAHCDAPCLIESDERQPPDLEPGGSTAVAATHDNRVATLAADARRGTTLRRVVAGKAGTSIGPGAVVLVPSLRTAGPLRARGADRTRHHLTRRGRGPHERNVDAG